MIITVALVEFMLIGQFKIIELITRILTNQSCDEITRCEWKIKFKNSLNKYLFILLIIIWSQSASILTKAFTGLFLNTYCNQKYTPIVETLQDIYLNKDITIASGSNEFIGFWKNIDESVELKNDIYNRAVDFEKKFKYSDDNFDYQKEYLFIKLIKGETVIMMHSGRIKSFLSYWKHQADNFHVSDSKYPPNYSTFFAPRVHPLAKSIKAL